MNARYFAKGFVAVAVTAMVVPPLTVDAKPRMVRVNGDGSTTDATQTTTATSTTTTTTSTTASTTTSTDASGLLTTLAPSLTPGHLTFAGRNWRVNAGSTWNENMPHSVKVSPSGARVRFEIQNTARDRSVNDEEIEKRRSEFSGSILGDPTRLPNGTSLWGAFSTVHEPWADPAGMRLLTGGVYGQIHMGAFGGSPAVAFRRRPDGTFRITTRGEFATSNTTRYAGSLPFGQAHDIVYNVVLHPTAGSLRVWVNGAKVVDVANVSIGSSQGGSYWAFGTYFSGGITSPVAAQYANHVYPSSTSLSTRITSRPVWPN